MEFKGLIPLSLIEYPGKMAAVVHTGGCNFRCPFCYNRDLVLTPDALPTIADAEVLAFLDQRRRWLDALCITGGEPTIHPGLPAFTREVKERGYLLQIQTNGTNPQMLRALIEDCLVDYVAMDVKAPLEWPRYRRLTGVDDERAFEAVLASMRIVLEAGVDHEFRTTFVPGLLSAEDLVEMASSVQGAQRYAVQQFVPRTTVDPELARLDPALDDTVCEIAASIRPFVREVEVRGTAGRASTRA